jgi:hypothetical protein
VARGLSTGDDPTPTFDPNITHGPATGSWLLPDEDDPADAHGPADPDAMTRTVPANLQRCWNCGTANEATRTFCQSCGQQLKQARTRRWRAVGRGAVAGASGRSQDEAGTTADPANRTRRLAVIAGAVAVVAVLLIAAAVMSGFLGGKDDVATIEPSRATAAAAVTGTGGAVATAPAASGAGGTDGAATVEPGATAADPAASGSAGRFRCETQTLAAPGTGRWEVRTVRYGDRAGFDYLTFNLRRRGAADATGGVTAELVPLADVETRFGFDAPDDGDVALVVRFDGPIGLNGSFGRGVGRRALREFRLLRESGVTYGVLGVDGDGCFELRSPDWAGGSGANAAITIDIER